MKSHPQLIDSPEFDDFFRRGDEPMQGMDSLQPMVSFEDSGADPGAREFRTPAQRERRARFIKLVSMTMAFLTIGSMGAVVHEAMKSNHAGSYQARPTSEPPAGPPSIVAQEHVRISGKMELVPAHSPKTNPVVPPLAAAKVGSTMDESKASSQLVPTVVPPPGTAAALDAVPVRTDPVRTDTAKSGPIKTRPVKADPVGLASTKRVDGKSRASTPASLVQRSVPVASPDSAPQKRAVSALERIPKAKAVGEKPEDYHPPTASFSD